MSEAEAATPAARLRHHLAAGMVEAPGAHDVLSARLVELAGFDAVYLGGSTTAAIEHGLPDTGVITTPELLDRARRTTDVVSVPVIADLDDGGGSPLAIRRAVRAAELAGVAAIHIEDVDYSAAKHLLHPDSGRVDPTADTLRSLDDALGNLTAALDARTDPDTVVIARTDALATHGLDVAIERAAAFSSAGVDLVFVPYLRISQLATLIEAAPCGVMAFFGNVAKVEDRAAAEELGLKLLIHPLPAMLPAVAATWATYQELKHTGTVTRENQHLDSDVLVRDALRHAEWTAAARPNTSA